MKQLTEAQAIYNIFHGVIEEKVFHITSDDDDKWYQIKAVNLKAAQKMATKKYAIDVDDHSKTGDIEITIGVEQLTPSKTNELMQNSGGIKVVSKRVKMKWKNIRS